MLDKTRILEALSASKGDIAGLHGQPIGDVDFQNHTFDHPVNLGGAIFTGQAQFSAATFKDFVSFDSAVFRGPTAFRCCRFERGAAFSLACFEDVDFFQTRFVGRAVFWRARFGGPADFSQVKVEKAEWPGVSDAGEANFSWARFEREAVFTYGEFATPVYFYRTVFAGDVFLDQCKFGDALCLNGKQNEVLFPRFDRIDPATVRQLELKGLFKADTERHRTYQGQRLSEFVCFNHVLSLPDLTKQLRQAKEIAGPKQSAVIRREWREGARKMFANGHLVSFRGTQFADLDRVSCGYLDLDQVVLDRQIAGSPEQRQLFDDRLRANSFDAFVSHASEDKARLARPLKNRLRQMGFAVWLDESALEIGDALTPSLDSAMRTCRHGIVILSPAYIRKDWTRYELERLLALAGESGKKLFFVWHKLNEEQVKAWSPEIADRLAFRTDQFTIGKLAERLASAMR